MYLFFAFFLSRFAAQCFYQGIFQNTAWSLFIAAAMDPFAVMWVGTGAVFCG